MGFWSSESCTGATNTGAGGIEGWAVAVGRGVAVAGACVGVGVVSGVGVEVGVSVGVEDGSAVGVAVAVGEGFDVEVAIMTASGVVTGVDVCVTTSSKVSWGVNVCAPEGSRPPSVTHRRPMSANTPMPASHTQWGKRIFVTLETAGAGVTCSFGSNARKAATSAPGLS